MRWAPTIQKKASSALPHINSILSELNSPHGVKGLSAKVNRELNFIELIWRKQNENIVELQLFTKAGDYKEFKLYQVLPKDLKDF